MGAVRALTYAAFGATPVVSTLPDPTPPPGRRRGAGARERPVPQRLARLDGPRRRHHDLPPRAGPRAGGRGRVGRRRRGCRVAGSRGHRTLRHGLRGLRGVPGRRRPGLPEPAPAGLHRPGLVRRARRRARRRDQPRGPARRARPGGRGRARLPGRDGPPGRGVASRGARGRLGAGHRLRRGRARGRRDRAQPGRLRVRGRRLRRLPRPGPVPRRRRGGRRLDRRRQGASPPSRRGRVVGSR